MNEKHIRPVDRGIEIAVKVVPGASRDRLAGLHGDALKIQVAAPPERGKANAAVEGLLATVLEVPIRSVKVIRGHASPRKIVRVDGMAVEMALAKLTSDSSRSRR